MKTTQNTMKTLEDRHPKPWRIVTSMSGHACIVDANSKDGTLDRDCVVIGRLKYKTDFDKLLANHIVKKLNS